MELVYALLLGAAAGWIAGQIMKGGGFGVVGNIIVGILGGLLGGIIFGALGLAAYGLIGRLICAVLGAVALLWLLRFVKK
jgi:uncharacterized membrane protein YeaQ/YmgE (transglycosylase-associated protein family)